MASVIATGNSAKVTPFKYRQDELEKVISSFVDSNKPFVVFDNIEHPLGGGTLEAAVTADEWSSRRLATNQLIEAQLHTVFCATGKNLTYIGDMPRRVLPIRLFSNEVNPETRTDFKLPANKLLDYCCQHRSELVIKAISVLRAYQASGSPTVEGEWGSFSGFVQRIRNAIVWAGAADPLETKRSLETSDETKLMLAKLAIGLLTIAERTAKNRETDRRDLLTALEIRDHYQESELLTEGITELCNGEPEYKTFTRVFPQKLKLHLGRVVLLPGGKGKARITSIDGASRRRYYRVELLG